MTEIVENDKKVQDFYYIRMNVFKLYLYYMGCILSFGGLYLLFKWNTHLRFFYYNTVESINEATFISFYRDGHYIFVELHENEYKIEPKEKAVKIKYIDFNHNKYTYEENSKKWINLGNRYHSRLFKNLEIEKVHFDPLDKKTADELRKFYGRNLIKIELGSNLEIIADKLLQPLNVYEIILIFVMLYLKHYSFVCILAIYILT